MTKLQYVLYSATAINSFKTFNVSYWDAFYPSWRLNPTADSGDIPFKFVHIITMTNAS